MRTVTTRFEEHRYPVAKSLPCPRCGKKVRRQRTFTGTSNPFTTPPYMNWREMKERLQPEIDEWLTRPEKCTPCRDVECQAARWEAASGLGRLVCVLDTGHAGDHDNGKGRTWSDETTPAVTR